MITDVVLMMVCTYDTF